MPASATRGKLSRQTALLTALALQVLLGLFAGGCKAQPKAGLAGKLQLSPEWDSSIFLVRPRGFSEIAADFLGEVIDSAKVAADGSFSFAYKPRPGGDVMVQLVLRRKGARYPTQLFDEDPARANYMPLVLSPHASVIITANASAFQSSLAIRNPSLDNRQLLRLRDLRLEAWQTYKSEAAGLQADSLLMDLEDAGRRYKGVMMAFADTTQSLHAALLACRWVSPDGDFERMPEFIVGQCEKWSALSPSHPFVPDLCQVVAGADLPVLVGDIMPELVMPLVSGDTVPLRNRLGDKLTLVDFWASWCAPCRRENRNVLVPLFAAHAADGFNIVAYGLESSRSAWVAAIQKDGATWTHASHLSGDSGPVMDALRLRTIPANFLLDPEGRVVAKNLYGEELVRFVDGWMR